MNSFNLSSPSFELHDPAVMIAANAVADELADHELEHLVLLDAFGRERARNQGTKFVADVPMELKLDKMLIVGGVVVHNHPMMQGLIETPNGHKVRFPDDEPLNLPPSTSDILFFLQSGARSFLLASGKHRWELRHKDFSRYGEYRSVYMSGLSNVFFDMEVETLGSALVGETKWSERYNTDVSVRDMVNVAICANHDIEYIHREV